jgi:hypothetical protein
MDIQIIFFIKLYNNLYTSTLNELRINLNNFKSTYYFFIKNSDYKIINNFYKNHLKLGVKVKKYKLNIFINNNL